MSNSLNSHIIKSQNLDDSQKTLDFRFVSGKNTHLPGRHVSLGFKGSLSESVCDKNC